MTSWEEARVWARERTGVGSRRRWAPRETARRRMGHFGPEAVPGEDVSGWCSRLTQNSWFADGDHLDRHMKDQRPNFVVGP
jgi:hypothetical protein